MRPARLPHPNHAPRWPGLFYSPVQLSIGALDMTNFVHQPFTLWAVGTELDSHCGFLAFGKDAPGVVEIVLPHHDGSGEATSYVVDRALLAIGLLRRASNGAIVVRPHNSRAEWLIVTLTTPSGAGDFYADAVALRQFLDATTQLAPMEVAA